MGLPVHISNISNIQKDKSQMVLPSHVVIAMKANGKNVDGFIYTKIRRNTLNGECINKSPWKALFNSCDGI